MTYTTTTKSFTFLVPKVQISENEFSEINQEIKKVENKLNSNLINSIDTGKINYLIHTFFEVKNRSQKVSKIIYSPIVYSKSKKFDSSTTQLSLEFYKNGKLKKYKIERVKFPNYKCYNGYTSSQVVFI